MLPYTMLTIIHTYKNIKLRALKVLVPINDVKVTLLEKR